MTKQNNNVGWIRLGLAVMVVGAGVVSAFVLAQADIRSVKAETSELKNEGCNPSGRNEVDIALIQKDIQIIQKTQMEIKQGQKDGFKSVIEAINKN